MEAAAIGTSRDVSWRQADAQELPFDDDSFEAVLCQFGVMFFPDRIAGYSEARRVLTPGGQFVFNVWDRIETNEFAETVTAAAAEVFPQDPPRFLPRTPHGYFDTDQITEELAQAGFSDIQCHTLDARSTAPDASHPAIAYCQGTPLRNEIEARDPGALDEVTRVATAIGVIGGVRAFRHDDQLRPLALRAAQTAIAHQLDLGAMALGHLDRLILYRTGVGVDVERQIRTPPRNGCFRPNASGRRPC